MNGAGGNSTRLAFDNDDDYDDGTPLCSIMFAATTLVLVLVLFKIIYERWVTPLSEVPGKFWHSISGLPMRYHMMRGQLPEVILELHEKYGPVVRLSPQRVSINDISMARQILGSHSFAKAPAYDLPESLMPNTFSTRSPELNIERRKRLGPSFSHKHLHDMEPSVLQCGVHNVDRKIDELLELQGAGQQSVVVQYHALFSLIAFDVIGILGFGQKFDALKTGHHELIPILTRIRIFNYFALAFPWLKAVPRLLGGRFKTLASLVQFSQNAIDRRRNDPSSSTVDLLQMMLDSNRTGQQRSLNDPEMVSETILHLVAGVDTTSNGLTWTLLLLLHNPHILDRLTTDIRQEFPVASNHTISFEDCRQRLPYLTAVINESLRVLSPAPSILPRVVPSGGLRVGGFLLPAGSLVCPSIAPVHMNPALFSSPSVFNPERFLGQGSEKANMIAFSTGVRACLGRNLALLELHVVLANLLRSYNLQLPPNVAAMGENIGDKPDSVGVVPNIPHMTQMTMTPKRPDRDCLVHITRAQA